MGTMEQSKAEQLEVEQASRNTIEIRKLYEETNKYLEESRKYIAESRKLEMDTRLTSKKVHWFEATIMLAVVAATVTLTKLFL